MARRWVTGGWRKKLTAPFAPRLSRPEHAIRSWHEAAVVAHFGKSPVVEVLRTCEHVAHIGRK